MNKSDITSHNWQLVEDSIDSLFMSVATKLLGEQGVLAIDYISEKVFDIAKNDSSVKNEIQFLYELLIKAFLGVEMKEDDLLDEQTVVGL